jgi:hypothetical protein
MTALARASFNLTELSDRGPCPAGTDLVTRRRRRRPSRRSAPSHAGQLADLLAAIERFPTRATRFGTGLHSARPIWLMFARALTWSHP